MRVLLIGEFSGLHSGLAEGLRKLGHTVDVVSTGDDFKKIDGTLNIDTRAGNAVLRLLKLHLGYVKLLPKFRRYDVVQFISIAPHVIPTGIFAILLMRYLRSCNRRIFLNSCGLDFYTAASQLGNTYSPLGNELLEGDFRATQKQLSVTSKWVADRLLPSFDGIVSSGYEYHQAYKKRDNYLGFIPMPVSMSAAAIGSNVPDAAQVNEAVKIKILHGIIRPTFKGSSYIVEAMKRLQMELPELVDCRLVEKLPYSEYLDHLDWCDILIDQACSFGYGMNGLLGLARAKVVLSGNEPEAELLLGRVCPVINIRPKSEAILESIRKLVESDELKTIGRASKLFAEDVHECQRVAGLYIDAWLKASE